MLKRILLIILGAAFLMLAVIITYVYFAFEHLETISFTNNSDRKLYLITSQLYPDTSTTVLLNNPAFSYYVQSDTNFAGDSLKARFRPTLKMRYEVCGQHQKASLVLGLGSANWKSHISSPNVYDRLVIYIFDAHIVDSLGWQPVLSNKECLKILTPSINNLKRSDWKVNY